MTSGGLAVNNRPPLPVPVLRLQSMWATALRQVRSPDVDAGDLPCLACGSSGARTCPFCLLAMHSACARTVAIAKSVDIKSFPRVHDCVPAIWKGCDGSGHADHVYLLSFAQVKVRDVGENDDQC
eukprot:2010474-Pyramimonas_sp.AAC.1